MKYSFNYYFSDIKNYIKCLLFPRQRWLTRKIPRQYHDKDKIIEIILFECLKNYVEVELGKQELFNKNRWSKNDNVPKHQLKFEKELKIHYNLLTITLPKLQKNLENEWNKISDGGYHQLKNNDFEIEIIYDQKYGKIDLADSKIEKLKDKIILWIVQNRRSLWT